MISDGVTQTHATLKEIGDICTQATIVKNNKIYVQTYYKEIAPELDSSSQVDLMQSHCLKISKG